MHSSFDRSKFEENRLIRVYTVNLHKTALTKENILIFVTG